jgi:hypothetical protein
MTRYLLILLLSAGFANAAPPDNRPPDNRPPDRGDDHGPVIVDLSTSSQADSIAKGGAGGAGGEGGEGGSSRADGGAGGASNVNINEVHPDDIKIKNTPSARAPYANSTGPCRVGGSIGVSLPGFGASGGGSKEDPECTLRQTAQTFSALGAPAMGLWILCRSVVLERVGSNSSDCDAKVAQFQIEAQFDYEEGEEDLPGK